MDVVVGKGAAILELLAGEDQALLVRGNALLVLDLGLDIVYESVNTCLLPYDYSGICAMRLRRRYRGRRREWVCVPMVSEDSTSRVMVLPVTKVAR